MSREIVLNIESGVVDIKRKSGDLEDVDIVIRDYDLEGSEDNIQTDENGDKYVVTIL